jgi:DUF4097 and DUF4098 domain-containing protein YvlB
MSQDKMRVLQKVDQGELTVDEAAELLAGKDQEYQEHQSDGLWSWLEHLMTAFGPKVKHSREQAWEFEAQEIAMIMAKTTNGSIKVTGGEQSRVMVNAQIIVRAGTKEAAEEFAAQVQVYAHHKEQQLRLYQEHPKPPFGVTVAVHYEIECPKAVDLKLHSANGKIRAEGVAGTIEAKTHNGGVILQDVSGGVQARTANGKIEASIVAMKETIDLANSNGSIVVDVSSGIAPVMATTSNGSIDLTLPPEFTGRVEAQTVNGRIQSELATTKVQRTRNHLAAQIGEAAEPLVSLRTINGRVRLKTRAVVQK